MRKSQDENTENSLKVLLDFICDELMSKFNINSICSSI